VLPDALEHIMAFSIGQSKVKQHQSWCVFTNHMKPEQPAKSIFKQHSSGRPVRVGSGNGKP